MCPFFVDYCKRAFFCLKNSIEYLEKHPFRCRESVKGQIPSHQGTPSRFLVN